MLIERIAIRKQLMIALEKDRRYGVIAESLLWEIHRAYLVAEAYNHPTLAKAFLDDYNAVLEERKANSDWEPDPDFEKTMRKAAMEGATNMIRQLGSKSI